MKPGYEWHAVNGGDSEGRPMALCGDVKLTPDMVFNTTIVTEWVDCDKCRDIVMGHTTAPFITADERMQYSRLASSLPADELVYTKKSVEAILKERLEAAHKI